MTSTTGMRRLPQDQRGRRVDLILPPADDCFSNLDAVYPSPLPPSGLAIIMAQLLAADPSLDVRILDGSMLTEQEIVSAVRGEWVGLSTWSVNQTTSARLAAEIRRRHPGAFIFVGGPNATHRGRQIMRHQPAVDAIVHGDGEIAVTALVTGTDPIGVTNLIFRNGHGICENPSVRAAPGQGPVFDFESLVPSFRSDRAPIPLSSIRGCIKAARTRRCSYCSIGDLVVRVARPEAVWRQVDRLSSMYGVDYFFETGDDFLVGRYPQKLLESRPQHLNHTSWRIYAYPEGLDVNTLNILAALNVRTIFLGVETVTRRAAVRAGRVACLPAELHNLVKMARDRGIRLMMSWVFGLSGESLESLRNNLRVIEGLVAEGASSFEAISVSLATPVAGSDLFEQAGRDKEVRRRYYQSRGSDFLEDDLIDYHLLSQLAIDRLASVPHEDVLECVQRARQVVHDAGVVASTFMGVEEPVAVE